MTRPYVLHYAPDNASMVIRLALEELQLPFDTVLVDRARQEQTSPEYLRLNPNGLIPVLETPDGPLFETAAILLWLNDTHGGLGAAPEHPGRVRLLKWVFFLSNTLHPALRMMFYPGSYIGERPEDQAQLRRIQQDTIRRHLSTLNAQWQPRATPSMLELYLAPMLRWLALYPAGGDHSWFQIANYPALYHMAAQLEMRPSTFAVQTDEGLGPMPFTAPQLPNPPQGSAT